MAPSISPSSTALEVPTAWLHVPMETPAAAGSLTLKILISTGLITAPRMPVITTAATVMDGMPESWLLTSMAIGVVTDLGIRRPSDAH